MSQKKYTAILLASPVSNSNLAMRKHGYEELYSSLSPHSKISMSFAHSETDSVNENISESLSKSVNNSVSNSNGTSTSESRGRNQSDSFGSSMSSEGWGVNSSSSSGSFSSYTSGTTFSRTMSQSTGKQIRNHKAEEQDIQRETQIQCL